jgi:two-component system, cell cycle sensor histidine kinase and response regulator CckA
MPGSILFVEDNPITRKMLRIALEMEGFHVWDAADGGSALDLAAAHPPDLVIVDYVLPDVDGLTLLEKIRCARAAPNLPAIVVTGMVSRLAEFRSRSNAATHFLGKPVAPSRLVEMVRAHLEVPASPFGGARILAVDDEPLNLKLIAVRLRRAGYEVETAAGGAQALGMARRHPPDVILSDVLMPSMDGFTLAREVRQDPGLASIPVVLVSSAYVDAADERLAREMGATALVVRSPDLDETFAAVEEAGRGHRDLRTSAPGPAVAALHQERLQVQLERQTARNEALLREAAIQATTLSIIRGLAEVLAKPREVPNILADVLVHCLDAAGLSAGLLYLKGKQGHYLHASFGIAAGRLAEAERCFGHPELIGRVADAGQVVALSRHAETEDAAARDFLGQLDDSYALLLPLTVLGDAFGVLVLGSDGQDLRQTAWLSFARSLALQFGQTVALGQSVTRLTESEGRYRALVENANDAIYVLDAQDVILQANQQSVALLGRPRDQTIGRHISDLVPPGGETDVERFHQAVAAGGNKVENVTLRRGDGTLVEVDFSLAVSEIDGVVNIVAIGRDVTERNRTARELKERMEVAAFAADVSVALIRNEPFSAVLQRCAEAMMRHLDPAFARIWTLEGDTLVLQASAGLYTHLDGAHSRVPVGRFKIGMIASERVPHLTNDVQHDTRVSDPAWAQREGMVAFAGYPLIVGDDLVGVMAMFARHALSQTVLDAMAAVANQIALGIERRSTEDRLHQSEEQYRLLFDTNPFPMAVIEKKTLAFLAVNDGSVRTYGFSRDEFLAMSLPDLRSPEDAARLASDYGPDGGAGPGGHQLPGTRKHRRKDGTLIEVEIVRSPIPFEGRPAWLALASDVTQKKSLEAQLVQAQKMEAVGQLAGGVAHDFNNLLGVITGYTELLIRGLPEESRERKRGEEIKRAADLAAALTRQLLAFGRRQVLQPRVLDLNETIAHVEKMMRRLISESIEIVLVPAPDLGRVRADLGQVEQVLLNLAINARDAMPAGGRLVIETSNVELDEAHARTNPDSSVGPHVLLSVTDTGHGMDAATMSRIFEPFFTTKEEGKGTGLGLATVYGIVRQSGGTVVASSKVGRGTTFKIYLPRVAAEVTKETLATAQPAPGGRESILLVEDAEPLRLLIRELLEEAGYAVIDAEAPDAALLLVAKMNKPIDLLITDMVMPGMNGPEFAKRISALHPRARVLLMSGYSDQALSGEGILEPGTLFLQKPFRMDDLMSTIRRALDSPPPPARP